MEKKGQIQSFQIPVKHRKSPKYSGTENEGSYYSLTQLMQKRSINPKNVILVYFINNRFMPSFYIDIVSFEFRLLFLLDFYVVSKLIQ